MSEVGGTLLSEFGNWHPVNQKLLAIGLPDDSTVRRCPTTDEVRFDVYRVGGW